MPNVTNLKFACLVTLASTTLAGTAVAQTSESFVSAMRYVSVDAQADNADANQVSGSASFTLGKYVWLQGTLGQLKDDSSNGLGDLQNFGIGMGVRNQHAQATLNFSRYRNDANYRQRDITASLEWLLPRLTLGVDGFHRTTDDSADYAVTDTYPLLGSTTVLTHAEQQLTGKGFGVHGSFNFTDKFSLSAGAMNYSYHQDLDITTNVSAAQYPLIARIIENRLNGLLQQRLAQRSGAIVTRNVLPLDSSYNVGLSYLFDAVGVSAQYLHDELLNNSDATDTVTLGVSVFLGEHWLLAPLLGQSRSDHSEDVNFGGLSLSYNW